MASITRRVILGSVAAIAAAGVVATAITRSRRGALEAEDAVTANQAVIGSTSMNYRDFGATGMKVSEVGFGAWGIGGTAYGDVDRQESLRALARAEELGCNFVDTAAVYGDSEAILGEFLRGRRDRWIVSTKYSNQPEGMERLIESQLRTLGVEAIDFYQVHWSPSREEHHLYETLYRLKKAGKARAVGISLKNVHDIDRVLSEPQIDGFMVPFSLLDPEPFLSRLERLRDRRLGVIVRSALREGFLTGRFTRDATFTDSNDQRSTWSREQIEQTVDAVERFRFLEQEAGSMVVAAAAYPLSFPQTSTVIMGTTKASYADVNFGAVPRFRLSMESLRRIEALQRELGLRRSWVQLLKDLVIEQKARWVG